MTKYSDKADAIVQKMDLRYSQSNIGTFTDLQALITNASSGDIITLDKDYKYNSTTDSSLSNGIVIEKTITIKGNGHIIDGNATQRVFYMNNQNGKTLTLEDLRIQNCKNTLGGAIYLNNHCNMNINNCIFTNNSTSSYDGGVISITDNCNVNITNSDFINNTSLRHGGVFYLQNNVNLKVNNSRFIGNKASIGGVFFAWTNTYLTINNSIFLQNKTTNYEGGVLYTSEAKDILITDCIFTNNSSNKFGGVIYASEGYITLKRCQLTNNSATQRGGALDINNINSSHPLQIIDSEIHSNTCNNYANAYVSSATTVYNCILSDTASTYYNLTNYDYVVKSSTVGLIKNDGSIDTTNYVSDISGKQDLLVSGTNIKSINNESLLGSGNITIQGGSEIGTFTELQQAVTYGTDNGILILEKDYKYNSTTDSSLSGGIEITQNIIIIGNGHIIDGNNYARAFIDDNGYTWELNDLKIQNCTNDNDEKYGYHYGGAIYVYSNATVNINNTQFNQNIATGGGGAIYTDDDSSLTINNSTFNQNIAENFGGGAIYNDGTLIINNTQLNKNTSEEQGGAIYNEGNLNIKEGIIKNNQGDIYANIYSENSIIVYNCDINDISTTCYNVTNITTESLNSSKQNTLISGTNIKTINNNSLLGSGNISIQGGVEVGSFNELQSLINNAIAPSGQIPIIILEKDYKYDSTIDSNLTDGVEISKNIIIIGNGHIIDGNNTVRAFYIVGNFTTTLSDLRIQNCNDDGSSGGAICVEAEATINITNIAFNHNITDNVGGAIYAEVDTTININNTQFTNNIATYDGGTIYLGYGATVTMKNSIFQNNISIATNYNDICSESEIIVYDCVIPNIATSCDRVTNITTESLYNSN